MKKLIVRPGLFLKKDEEKAIIDKIKKAWKEDNFVVIPPECSYEVVDDNVDVLKQAREEIEQLKHKTTDVEGYRWWNNAIENCLHELDRLIAESEGVNG